MLIVYEASMLYMYVPGLRLETDECNPDIPLGAGEGWLEYKDGAWNINKLYQITCVAYEP